MTTRIDVKDARGRVMAVIEVNHVLTCQRCLCDLHPSLTDPTIYECDCGAIYVRLSVSLDSAV